VGAPPWGCGAGCRTPRARSAARARRGRALTARAACSSPVAPAGGAARRDAIRARDARADAAGAAVAVVAEARQGRRRRSVRRATHPAGPSLRRSPRARRDSLPRLSSSLSYSRLPRSHLCVSLCLSFSLSLWLALRLPPSFPRPLGMCVGAAHISSAGPVRRGRAEQ
jgi:hypothetical protein